MPRLMWLASALMAVTTAVHVLAGTPEIMGPIQNADLPPVAQSTAMVVWHMISLLLGVMTLALAYLARRPNAALALFILALQLSFAALFMFYTLSTFGALFALPQWTMFALVATLIIAARPGSGPSHKSVNTTSSPQG